MKKALIWGLMIFFAALPSAALAHEEDKGAPPEVAGAVFGQQLGSVQLPFACGDGVRQDLEQGLALLHNMTYVGARAIFVDVAVADPECAMGYWGQAMSYIHPLWSDPPAEEDFKSGKALAAVAKKLATGDRERAYVAAVASYYGQGRGSTETANLNAFEKGWRAVYQRFPDDPEGAAFYALALMATASPTDKSYAKQKKSAEIAKGVLARIPDHPGGHHYVIHAYDYPPLAAGALEVARSYGKIAPEVPHALHMPAHIFTRLGLWKESIAMNRRSADAALKHPAGGKISLHYLHALDYMAYAHLQRGEDGKAQAVLGELQGTRGPYQTHVASAYTFAAVPARIALETQQWAAAAALKVQAPTDYPWQINPAMEAITHFSRAIGAARSGDRQVARRSIDQLVALKKRAAESSGYWGKQVEIQVVAAEAWLTFLEGKKEKALELMHEAAAMEAATEKHPVTPGEVLPAHELLADMLFEMGRYQEAGKNYLVALERSPNRFNSLYGAGRSAELAGDKKQAALHYGKLVEVAAADSGRERLKQAKRFLAGK